MELALIAKLTTESPTNSFKEIDEEPGSEDIAGSQTLFERIFLKAVTEFPAYTLTKALAAQAALVAEGKNPDEIKETLAASYKLEGEKLGYFMHALEVATNHTENLKRILVVKLNEGETAPAKAVQKEEVHLIPEFLILAGAVSMKPADGKGARRGGGRGNKNQGPKGSPWGLSPEEKAAKNKKPASP